MPFKEILIEIGYKLSKLTIILILFMSLVSGFNLSAAAQSSTPKPENVCSTFGNGSCLTGTDSYATGDSQTIISKLAITIVNILIFIASAIAVFFIVLGGYKYITANGDDSKIKEGRSMVINALIGLAIAIASYTFVSATSNFVSTVNISQQP